MVEVDVLCGSKLHHSLSACVLTEPAAIIGPDKAYDLMIGGVSFLVESSSLAKVNVDTN